jgi:hypothetical protein
MQSWFSTLVALGLFLQGCTPESAAISQPKTYPTAAVTAGGTPGPYTTEFEAQAAAVKALSGDPEAAFGLFLYYTGDRFEAQRMIYWLQIAAENGKADALNYFGSRLSSSDDPCRILRGIYFLKQANKSMPNTSQPEGRAKGQTEIDIAGERLRKLPSANCLRADASMQGTLVPTPR